MSKTTRLKSGAAMGILLYALYAGANMYVNAQVSTLQTTETQQEVYEEFTPLIKETIEPIPISSGTETAQGQVTGIASQTIGNSKEQASGRVETVNSSGHAVGDFCSLPDLPTNVKACTDYRCYGIRSTPHWRLQQVAWTDEWGLRRFNDDYIVGLGTYYSTDIGDRFEVTLGSGRVFTIILGDNKADCDTDETNRYKPCAYYTDNDANVLEFIADFKKMPDWVYARGSIDCIDEFAGDVVSLKYLGRDTSGDWDSYM